MSQLLSTALNNVDFTDLISPYESNNQTLHGILNGSHTSNVAAVYRPTTIPTPWPYLAASMGLSMLTTLVAFVATSLSSSDSKIHHFLTRTWDRIMALFRRSSKFKEPRQPTLTWHPFARSLSLGALFIITIRAISTFVASIQVLRDQGGRYFPMSALMAQNLAIMPYVNDTPSPTYWFEILASIDGLLCASSLVMMFCASIARGAGMGAAGYYGAVYLTGGTCPRSIGSCDGGLWVGCDDTPAAAGVNTTGLALITSSTNMTAVDSYLPFFFVIYLIVAFLIVAFSSKKRSKLFSQKTLLKIKRTFKNVKNGGILGVKPNNISALTREHNETRLKMFPKELTQAEFCEHIATVRRKRVLFWNVWYMLLMVVLAVITIPMHYNLETSPASTNVSDSRGPWLEASKDYDANGISVNQTEVWSQEYLSANGTRVSWSDCFEVTLVHDKNGFFEAWWENVRAEPAKWLAMI